MLEVQNVSFSYPGHKPLFQGVSFTVEAGERVALCAPSGAGKTTLLSLIAGYEKPTQGQILIDGKPLSKRGVSPIQMIFQHPERALDPRLRLESSVLEAGSLDERLMQALGIKREWLRRYPHELSGGECQRFCIMRALMAHPRFLVADEISTMLDAVTQAQLWHVLMHEAKQQGVGILLVSHVPALLDRVATRRIDLCKFTPKDGSELERKGYAQSSSPL